jgi:hypothetical protein
MGRPHLGRDQLDQISVLRKLRLLLAWQMRIAKDRSRTVENGRSVVNNCARNS